jgi:hypothetical protein
VYLNKEHTVVQSVLGDYRIPRTGLGRFSGGLDLVVISPEREILRHFHLDLSIGEVFPEASLRYSLDQALTEAPEPSTAVPGT